MAVLLIAFAVMQAFSAGASAQTMPEVVITGAKPLTAERASIGGFGEAPLLLHDFGEREAVATELT